MTSEYLVHKLLSSCIVGFSQDLEESPVEEEDDYFDEASLTEGFTEDGGDSVAIESQEIRIMRRQMQGLETMYSEILKCIGG